MPPKNKNAQKQQSAQETATNEEAAALVASGEAEPGPELTPDQVEAAGGEKDETPPADDKPKDPDEKPEHPPRERKLVLLQSNCAGVWAGELASHDKDQVVLKNARRLWSWGKQLLPDVAAAGLHPKEGAQVLGLQAEVKLKDKILADPKRHHVFPLSDAAYKSILAAPEYSHPKLAH